MGWALYVQPQSIAIPTIAHCTIQGIINHRHLGRFQTTTGVYGFLWVNPAVWNSTVLREGQSIWQISLLTDGVQSIQQSICCILILSHVDSRIWTQNAAILYCCPPVRPSPPLTPPLTPPASLSCFVWRSGHPHIRNTPLLRKCNGICSHLLM